MNAILINLVLSFGLVIGFLFAYKHSRKVQHYDERQELLQNRGYKYASFAMLISASLAMMWSSYLSRIASIELVALFILLIAIVTFVTYAVLNDAYFPLNKGTKLGTFWLMFLVSVVQLIIVIKDIVTHTFSRENGMGNLMFFVAFALISMSILYKNHQDKKGE